MKFSIKFADERNDLVILPYYKEAVAVNVPRFHSVFSILKHNLQIGTEIGFHDRSLKVTTTTSGVVRDTSKREHPLDLVVISQFKWCISRYEGHTIHSISLLAIDNWSRILKSDCTSCVYQTIMV